MIWWSWSTEPEHIRRNFLKGATGLVLLFLSGFPVFLEAGGGMSEQVQQVIHDRADGDGIVTAIDHGMHWFESVSWPMRVFVAVFVLLLVHFWRGGGLTFKGVGLKGRGR